MKTLNDYKKYFDKLQGEQYFGRFGKTFTSDEKFYFLDTGTGKIAEVNSNVFCVMKALLENNGFDGVLDLDMSDDNKISALQEIVDAVEKEHILSAPPLKTLVGEPVLNLERTYNGFMSNLTLEVTDRCNLRCKYCIYNPDNPSFRGFGKSDMNFDTAKLAIDFFEKHSREREKVYLGFYGGEPLLNYKLIEQSVNYAKEIIRDKEISFSLTTNATLITPQIAKFLVENEFEILISLDGPKDIHNENRIFINGNGSFNSTIEGTKVILECYKQLEKEPKIGFSMVTSGPNYDEKYSKIQDFFEKAEWLPKNYILLTSTVSQAPVDCDYILPQSEEERNIHKNVWTPLLKWSNDQEIRRNLFSMPYLNKNLSIIHQRLWVDKPTADYGMNGCCVPGGRRIYIAVNGDIYPCEKIGDVPTLGNVKTGLEIEKIKKVYVKDFIDEAREYCKNCWAVNLCTLCYVNCYDKNGVHFKYRHRACVSERKFLEDTLSTYHYLVNHNPKIIEELNQIKFE